MSRDVLLTVLIFAGLALGIVVGQFVLHDPTATASVLSERTSLLQTVGELSFIRPLKMMIIPLVFVSVVVGVTSIGNPEKLGLIGGATLLYYFSTMLLAVGLGLVLVNIVQPGAGVVLSDLQTDAVEAFGTKQEAIESGASGGIGGA